MRTSMGERLPRRALNSSSRWSGAAASAPAPVDDRATCAASTKGSARSDQICSQAVQRKFVEGEEEGAEEGEEEGRVRTVVVTVSMAVCVRRCPLRSATLLLLVVPAATGSGGGCAGPASSASATARCDPSRATFKAACRHKTEVRSSLRE